MEIRTLADVASEVLRLTLNPPVLARFRDQIAEFQRDAGRYIHEARVWEEWPSKLVRATKRGSRLRNHKAGAPTPNHTWWVAAVGGHGKPIVQFGAWLDLRERGPKPIDPRVPGWLPMDYGLCAAAHDHVCEGKGKRPELRLGHIVPDQYPAKSDAKLGVALASAQRVAWGALKYWSVAGEDDREPTEQEHVGRLIVALNHVRADLEAHGLVAAPTAKKDAGVKPSAPPAGVALTTDHESILAVLGKTPKRCKTVIDVSSDGTIRSRETVGRLLGELARFGLVDRPHGMRKGYALTEAGRMRLSGASPT